MQREEAAKKARVDAGKRRQQAAAEEEIKEAGKRMLEEAQKKAAAALSSATAAAAGPSRPPQATNGHSNGESSSRPTPSITPLDLTLILQFPPASNPEQKTLQHSLSRAYGPIAHVFIKDPVPAAAEPGGEKKKKPKPKGRRAIVEFQEGNWGGCWSCWRDVDVGDQQGRVEGLEGVKVKWAAGKTPDWVDWATPQAQGPDQAAARGRGPEAQAHPTGGVRAEVDPLAGASAGTRTTLPSFDSAPDFAKSTMADLLASHNRSRDDEVSKKRKEQEFESMTLLKMRQMERDRLAEQIRREEEEEGVA